jgi:hypothetical protein
MTHYECLDQAAKALGSPPAALRLREILDKAGELFSAMANVSEASASATMDYRTINIRGRTHYPRNFDVQDDWNRSPAFIKVERAIWRRLSEEERAVFAILWSKGETLLRQESFDVAEWEKLFQADR